MDGAPPHQRPPEPPPEPTPARRQPGNARWLEALLTRVSGSRARHWLATLRSRLPAWAPAAALMVGLASCWVAAGRSGDTVGESASRERARDNDELIGESQEGQASWYGGKFHGRRTASGERFNKHKLTAAHPKWPFGTRVRVTNLNNNRSVVVRINDRGPYGGRIIDISEAAARKLGMIKSGVAPVRIEIVGRRK